jgi:hypothetical protein
MVPTSWPIAATGAEHDIVEHARVFARGQLGISAAGDVVAYNSRETSLCSVPKVRDVHDTANVRSHSSDNAQPEPMFTF